MRLAVNVPQQGAGEAVEEAERLGYEIAFVPEGYRSDAASLLGYIAARTTRIHLAAGVFQMPGRTPVMTAMTTAMLDGLSGGRFRIGLGSANAHVMEGWHGAPFDRPLGRTREYVAILRAALAGKPVVHLGEHFRIPLPGGRGEPFRLPGRLINPDIPIYLAAVGPRALELAGEIADGWFGVFCSPDRITEALGRIRAGAARSGRGLAGFEVIPSVPIVVGADPAVCADAIRNYVARFVSLGDRAHNFYYAFLEKSGHGAAAATIWQRFRDGDLDGAAAAVPFDFLDATALLGPPDRIADRLAAYAAAGVTTIALSPFAADPQQRLEALRVAAAASAALSPLTTKERHVH
ncbi:LLM class F420-dependent oxidoreductase [Paractinoplanes ferrugineus]|uniref:LLM class F420-dependent oxidoreductase n=1 Tax=Paractinoplanes ferrugineus TaxID=113564 RepID=A0A919MII1_9ACTN|nr:LLM class flavin-dependent oxidoreductase [Actinoplanes ferrugineus]GIE13710.1 LLM class F420-dependent oxidoreductase [Actinoplanes ferrugineus]